MASTMFPNSHRHHRNDERNELIGEFLHDSSLTTSLLYPNSSQQDRDMYEDNRTNSRQLLFDDVTKTSDSKCELTTTLRAGYKGWNMATGIMFDIKPMKDTIELLTLEIPTFENYGAESSSPAEARKIQVYYREGTFSNAMNDPSQWTLIAETSAELITPLPPPDSKNPTGLDMGALVPINDFKSVSLNAGQTYSLYIVGAGTSPKPSETLLKTKPADTMIGEMSLENDALQVFTGVRFKGSPFPAVFDDPADFNGVLHYREKKECNHNTILGTTEIILEFAVNQEPTSNVMGALRNAVFETLSERVKTNENLIRYTDDYMLKLEGIDVNFRGRSEEKCPIDFEMCSVVATTVILKHFRDLDRGLLEVEFLGYNKDLDGQVYSLMSPIETSFVDVELSKYDFAITLGGVPIGLEMNDVQRRYFEQVTLNFLRKNTEATIFSAVVSNEIPETPFSQDVEPPARRIRSRNLSSSFDIKAIVSEERTSMLRPSRKLEGSGGKIEIITEFAAAGTVTELRNTVLEAFGDNLDQYTMELMNQQFRPAEINENDNGEFFARLQDIKIKPYIPTFEEPTTNDSSGGSSTSVKTEGSGTSGTVWVIVCIVLIVLSLLWICYRIYMDCFYSPVQKQLKLSNSNDEFQDEEEASVKTGILGRLFPSKSPVTSDSDGTHSEPRLLPNGKNGRNQNTILKTRSFNDLLAAGDERRDNMKPLVRNMSFDSNLKTQNSLSRKPEDSFDDEDSLGDSDVDSMSDVDSDVDSDVEISGEMLFKKPQRSKSGPMRGRLAPSKSMPIQKRKKTEASPDLKKGRKALSKSQHGEKSVKSPPQRLPPMRGRLAPSKSMPMEKRKKTSASPSLKKGKKVLSKSNHGEKTPPRPRSKSNHGEKTKRSLSKSNHGERTPKSTSNRRGKMTPSKSMPVEKRDMKRSKSLDRSESVLAKKKKSQNKKASKSRSPAVSKSSRKKIDLDSDSKSSSKSSRKKQAKNRGVKASKSLPVKKSQQPQSDSNVVKRLSDMVHDSSESESEDTDSFSEVTQPVSGYSNASGQRSWKSDATPGSKRSYGRAGKISYRLSNVEEC